MSKSIYRQFTVLNHFLTWCWFWLEHSAQVNRNLAVFVHSSVGVIIFQKKYRQIQWEKMAKKGGKKGNSLVVSKVKRANHMKNKKKPNGDRRQKTTSQQNKKNDNSDNTQRKNKNAKIQQNPGRKTLKRLDTPKSGKKKQQQKTPVQSNGVIEDVFEADEMMDMMDEEDIDFFKSKAVNKNKRQANNGDIDVAKKARRVEIEEEYDDELFNTNKEKKSTRPLLPIKTRQGIVERSVEVEEASEESGSELEAEEEEEKEPLSMAEIYAMRQTKIEELKTAIGSASSSITENPEERMENISTILKLYKGLTADVYITGFKLISASLVGLFRDLAPTYEIKSTNKPGEKLKKATRVVYAVEGRLLKYYQMFLKKLEGFYYFFVDII